jgi:hypothetical protein
MVYQGRAQGVRWQGSISINDVHYFASRTITKSSTLPRNFSQNEKCTIAVECKWIQYTCSTSTSLSTITGMARFNIHNWIFQAFDAFTSVSFCNFPISTVEKNAIISFEGFPIVWRHVMFAA